MRSYLSKNASYNFFRILSQYPEVRQVCPRVVLGGQPLDALEPDARVSCFNLVGVVDHWDQFIQIGFLAFPVRKWGYRHSSVDSSAPTILPPQV